MSEAYSSQRLIVSDAETKCVLDSFGKENPFFTFEFVRAMNALGREIWVIRSRVEASSGDIALGFIKRGRLSVELEFVSLPPLAARSEFWDAVMAFCKSMGVTDIVASTFGSAEFELPPLSGETARWRRHEFVLSLQGVDLPSLLSSNHKRNVKKAQKVDNVTIRRGRDVAWLTDHVGLIGHSAERRVARGESVSMHADIPQYRAFLENGSGELFQVIRDGQVLSSVLVLSSPLTGYYQSAGTSAEGMNAGASHFLIHTIAETLQAEGCQEFNLGGAPEGSSLTRFKLGFGARTVPLTAAVCYVGPLWHRKLRLAMQLLRSARTFRAVRGTSPRPA